MERYWPEEALDFEAAVSGVLARAGGVDLARRCELDPRLRDTDVRPLLDELGLLDLDVAGDEVEAAAGALGVMAAGAVVCPWPLVQRLAVPMALRGELDAVYLRDGSVRRAEHLDVAGRAAAVDLVTGEARGLRPVTAASVVRAAATQPTGTAPSQNGKHAVVDRMPLDPFGVRCEMDDNSIELAGAIDVHVVLSSFWTVGALRYARDLAVEHARDRRQFGQRIADFGGVQWHLSDIALSVDGLWELASFSLARLIDGRLTAADARALQYTMLESAQTVLSRAHQVTAAIGLCEEHDLTVIDRHLQPVLRRPCGMTRALGLLAEEVAHTGFDNLYPIPAVVAAEA